MPEREEEATLALILGAIANSQKNIMAVQETLNALAQNMDREINVPETKVITTPVDMAPIAKAMKEQTAAFTAMTTAILSMNVKPKIEWDFDITRDSVNGHIKSIKATPGNE